MPNQLAVVRVLAEDIDGPQDGRVGECQTMPTDLYYDVEEAMAAVLERVAAAVDWPRLLAEAAMRHSFIHTHTLEDEDRPAGQGTRWECSARGVCGECLRHALLTDETGAHRWDKAPDVPLTREHLDWAPTVAAALPHRHTHPSADDRGRDASHALTEVRTVLSRAESALRTTPTEPLYQPDGHGLYDETGARVTAYDPDHDRIQHTLKAVSALLAPWRRTGRPTGTRGTRQAALQGVRCACGRLWAGRVGAGHTTPTTGEIMEDTPGTPGAEQKGGLPK
ncbi:hypothetical protein ABZ605_27685 [Streptomyces sp. NPDC012765]|uniref:hypothetical protein n=1 Tax=Streptomyces sp. NPDC012765 TaxID=3155249 RepID=UPI00340B2F8D